MPPSWTRAHTVPVGVNLRPEPSTRAPSLATLSADTEVMVLGETVQGDDGIWQRVRTEDGRDGWIIDSALE
jgi:SH3-like domain-containing protein